MGTDPAAGPEQRAGTDRALHRTLSVWSLFAISLGGIIGSGWLFGVLRAASIAGPAAILAWIIGALFTVVLAVSWWRVGAALPRSGGSARYVSYSHGSYAGFLAGWARLVTVGTIPAIEAEAVITALQAFLRAEHLPFSVSSTSVFEGSSITTLNGPGTLLAALLVVALFFVNLRGAQSLGRFNRWVSVWKVAVPAGTIVGLFLLSQASNFSLSGPSGTSGFLPYGLPSVFLAVSTSGVLFAYLGFAQVVDFSGEARDPRRDLPRAVLAGVLVAAAIYILLQVAFIGAINWPGAGVPTGDWHGLAGSTWGTLPLYYAITEGAGVGFAAMGVVLLSDAWVSPTGTGSIYLGSSARTIFGLSVDGFLPRILRRLTGDSRIPWVALVASLGFSLVFLLPLPSWYQLVALISSALVLSYLTAPIALPGLAAALPQRFLAGRRSILVAAWAGFEVVSVGIYWSGFQVLTWLVLVLIGGVVVFLAYYAPSHLGLRPRSAAVLSVLVVLTTLGEVIVGPLGSELGVELWATRSPDVVALFFALLLIVVGIVAVGLPLAVPRRHWGTVRGGSWFLPWVAATYVVSYLGVYGPAGGYPLAGALPFPWDTLASLALGGFVFLWTTRVGLPPTEVSASLGEPRSPDAA
jgi:amino acid transporter